GLERAPQAAQRSGHPGKAGAPLDAPRARSAPGKPGRSSILRQAPRVWLGIAWSVFQLYTAWAGLFDLLIQLPVHVAFAVALGFLSTPIPESAVQADKRKERRPHRWIDGILALAALGCALYYIVENPRLTTRMAMVDDPARSDVVVACSSCCCCSRPPAVTPAPRWSCCRWPSWCTRSSGPGCQASSPTAARVFSS
ncbi:MAG: hypothetical protein ACREKS_08780, partial [Candidatus Rokuibacteriota bacterium]